VQERSKGLGEFLLVDALRRGFQAGSEIGAFAFEVIAKNDAATRFYQRYGFRKLLDDERHLYLSMKTLEKLFPVKDAPPRRR
jgi:ribosomal protein S18 acetylase RimI-like enzyme